MYKERRDKVSIKFYILIALIVLIIIFGIILLIPHKKVETKKPVKMELYSKQDMEDIEKNYSKTFYNNFKELKKVSEKYFIKKQEALLDKQTVSLDKLINDNHLIATIYDEDGKKCNEDKSQVVYVKNSNNGNYKMTITLVCGKEEETLTTYMGNYDYCKNDTACEKQVEAKKKAEKVVEPETDVSPEPETEVDKKPIPVPTQEPIDTNDNYTLYEYVLAPSESCGEYSDWSDWSTNKIDASLYKEVDTKTDTKSTDYDCSDYRTERYISGYKEEKYVAGYTVTTTKVGTKTDSKGNVVAVYDTKKVPVYGTRKTPVYATRSVGSKKTCQKDISVTSYRYRTFEYKKGINYVRYSSSNKDQYLIAQGYVATGKTK